MLAVSGWPVAWCATVQSNVGSTWPTNARSGFSRAEQRERQRRDVRAEAGDALEQRVDRGAGREQAAEDRRAVAARAAAGVGVPDRAVRLPGAEQRLRLEQRVVVADRLAEVAEHRRRVGERAGLAVARGDHEARPVGGEPVVEPGRRRVCERSGRRARRRPRAVPAAAARSSAAAARRCRRRRDRWPTRACAAARHPRPPSRTGARPRSWPAPPRRAAGGRPPRPGRPRTGAPTGSRPGRRR